jgi:hypothetical protein
MLEKLAKISETRPRLTTGLLAALAGASALVYWLLFVSPTSLLVLYPYPRQDAYYLWNLGPPARWRLVAGFVMLSGFYLAGYWLALRTRGRAAWVAVIGGGLLFAGIMLFMQPIDAADIYDNIVHGRILGIYHANPFQQTAQSYPNDPFYPYMAWKLSPSAYGPVWEIMAGLAARASGDGIVVNVFAFKLLPGIFWLGCLIVSAFVLRFRRAPRPLASLVLLAWNPMVIYVTWGNGHNDIAMIFWVLVACLAFEQRRELLAVLALVLGALVKFVPLLLVPVVVIAALRRQTAWKARWSYLLKTGLAATLLVGLAYAPFWEGASTLSLSRRMALFSASLPASLYHLLQLWTAKNAAAQIISLGALSLTILFVLWRVLRLPIKPHLHHPPVWLEEACFDILAFYLLIACLWFQAWYTVWLLGLLPLMSTGARQRLAIVFGLTAPVKQLIIAPLLFWPKPVITQPWLEASFALGALGPPWLYAGYALCRSWLMRSRRLS